MSGKTDGKFLRLPHEIYDGSAFKTLNHGDIVVLLLLLRKFNGHNNGAIALGVREAAAKCDCSMTTACRALSRLQQAGLIVATYKGHMVSDFGRPNAPTRWRVTFIENVQGQPKGKKFHVAS